jgi:hypothetical protein
MNTYYGRVVFRHVDCHLAINGKRTVWLQGPI